ncbi:MAG: response regulator [Pirellulales bacterium]|nr:response regulator [Pirellulales bacterium]
MSRDPIGRPMEILLVEDNRMDAHFAIRALAMANFQHRCTLVANGEEAMDYLRRRGIFVRAPRPDLVLLDLGLPKKDGREVLSEIRDDENLRELPVVVMTGSTDEADRAHMQMLDVESYLSKPVDLDKFLGIVRELKRFWLQGVILPVIE